METTLRKTLGVSCMFMWIILAALTFGAVFDGLGAGRAIETLFVEKWNLSPWGVLIMMQLSYILMGMFLDDTAMLVIVAPLYVPLIIALGFDPIWYGVLYTITCQIAYMTPPFGYNLFLMNKKWYTLKKSNLDNSRDNTNRYDISYALSDYELFSKNNKYCLSLQGGIIADEVGLGKTFSTISHLINQIYRDKMLKTNEEHINYNYDCNNLIIVPARLVTQWKLEFKKCI